MLAEFVQELLKLKRPETVEVHGRPYATGTLQSIATPMASPVKVHSLTGLVDLIRADLGNVKQMDVAIHVLSEAQVDVIHLGTDIWGKRQTYLTALRPPVDSFKFGEWLSTEQFIIGLHALFFPTPEQKELLALCSTVKSESLAVSEDDGISQRATFGRSIAFKEERAVKPIVSLTPYRTFSEVDQPASNFLFRMRQVNEGKAVQCMLMEADGGVWKQRAMDLIKQWFEGQHLDDIKIVS